jgi:hypothetical protein
MEEAVGTEEVGVGMGADTEVTGAAGEGAESGSAYRPFVTQVITVVTTQDITGADTADTVTATSAS